MTTIDGDEVVGITIDGTEVVEVTMDGDIVWTTVEEMIWLEDFEDYVDTADLRSNYQESNIDNFYLEDSTPLSGSQSGRFEATNIRPVWDGPTEDGQTPVGESYQFLVQCNLSDGHPGILMEVETPSDALDTAYNLHLSWRDDHVNLRVWDNGSLVDNETFSITPLTIGDTYRVEFDYSESGGDRIFDVEVFDHSDDTSMGSGQLVTDTLLDGLFGWMSGRDVSSSDPVFVDDFGYGEPTGVEEATWETQSDWQAAQDRARILSQSYPSLDGNTLRQGYDVNDEPFTWYWTLNETDVPFSNEESSTAEWEMQSASAESHDDPNSYDFAATGLHDTTCVASEKDGHLIIEELPMADLKADWAFGAWVYYNDVTHGFQSSFGMCDLTADRDESVSFGLDDDEMKIYSVGRTPGHGPTVVADTWYHAVVRHDVTAEEFDLLFDGQFNYTVDYSGDPSWLDELTGMSLLNRHPGSNTEHDGRVADPFFYDGYPTDSMVERWYDTGSSGFLHADDKTRDGAASELEVTADIMTDTTLDITVKQGYNSTVNEQEVSINNGTNTYSLSGFDEEESDYWIECDFENTNIENTAKLMSATVR